MADLSKRKRQQRAKLLEALGFRRNGHGYGGPDEGYEPPAEPPVLDAATRQRVLGEYMPPWHALNGFAAHLTPAEMAEALVQRVAHLIPGAKILEPCAGIGHLIEAIRPHGPAGLQAWEWDGEMTAILSVLHPDITVQQANMWAAWQDQAAGFNLIIANAPFGDTAGRGTGRDLDFDGKPAELLSIEAIVRMLKPGGTAALILPSMAFNNVRWGAMNRWLEGHEVTVEEFDLPQVPFAFTSASVRGFLLRTAGSNGHGDPVVTEEVEAEEEELPSPKELLLELRAGSEEILRHLQRLQEMTERPLPMPQQRPGPVQLSLFGEV